MNEYGASAENGESDEDSRATGPLMHHARKFESKRQMAST